MKQPETETQVIPFVQAAVPAYVTEAGNSSMGNELVQSQDQAVPRLNLLQQLSAQLNRSKPEYIKEAAAGMFHNSVTNELFDELYVLNLFYKRTMTVFKKRDLGGGFAGNYANLEEARMAMISQDKDPDAYEYVDTANHYLLIIGADGKVVTPVIFSMNSSKLKVSNAWNTKILKQGGPRFASVWKLGTVVQSNNSGTWFNVSTDFAGWTPKELFEEAKLYYEQFRASGEVGSDEADEVDAAA